MSEKYAHTHLRANEKMQTLKGSPARDLFKQLHKSMLQRHMVGCDIDFLIVEKNPDCIVAFMDVKLSGDKVTFAEVIAYNALCAAADVYLLYTASEESMRRGEFEIKQYISGNRGPNPPTIKVKPVAKTANWKAFETWEQGLRNGTK